METIVVIPARYGSTRFPGKPLVQILRHSLLERVYRLGSAAQGIDGVIVATDDERIAEHVVGFGGDVVMTSAACRNGSERVHQAALALKDRPRIIVNLQGDTPLMPPWVLTALVEEIKREPTVDLATPAVRLTREQYERMLGAKQQGNTTGTTVTFDCTRNALYFSKGMIPYLRNTLTSGELPIFQHIGVYAYRWETLDRYVQLPVGPLEEVEQLEQLRALENGMPIRVVDVSLRGRTLWSVDNPQDVARVEEIITQEGELL
jgi:3-deoxy-manno-octulosonate cytidylyltransferase (CMP-KDO synthetase)